MSQAAKRQRLDEESTVGSSSTSPDAKAAPGSARKARPVIDPDAELAEAEPTTGAEEFAVTDAMKAEEERCIDLL